MQFSLMFFASDSEAGSDARYDLALRACKYADDNGFTSVWIPERHFHRFGGLYPNPAVLGAAIAVTTRRLRIRAGSVILPLNDPIRVAEEWSIVDNLSRGRVDLGFGQGWNPNDFVLQPQNFASRLNVLQQGIEEVRQLWSGKSIRRRNGQDQLTDIRIYPEPVQEAFGLWITCSGAAERFEQAGRAGAAVLTALLFQDIRELRHKIASYRDAFATSSAPGTGHVTLMLHTYIGEDPISVRHAIREPFMRYLRDSTDLWKQNFPRFDDIPPDGQAKILEFAFEKYVRTHSLCGSVGQCIERLKSFQDAGVDEIACLIDFGVRDSDVLESLRNIQVISAGLDS